MYVLVLSYQLIIYVNKSIALSASVFSDVQWTLKVPSYCGSLWNAEKYTYFNEE